MVRRNSPALWVLPSEVHPQRTRCFMIEVPDEREYIAAFRGALMELASGYNWADDPDHLAREVALVWRDLIDQVDGCPEPPRPERGGIEIEDSMSSQIRISPDDSCIIQMWCIDHWEDWYDPRSCIGSSIGQPPPGGTLEPGESKCYPVVLTGNSQWLLPVAVNPGDTVTITSADGGWNDGTSAWSCPSGQYYTLGICGVDVVADPADPLQTVNHMRLIAFDGSDYYDAFNRAFSVLPGSSDRQLVFQANDSTLSDNQGSITFNVCVSRTEEVFGLSSLNGDPVPVTSLMIGQEVTVLPRLQAGYTDYYYGDYSIDPCVNIEIVGNTGQNSGSQPVLVTGIGRFDCAASYHVSEFAANYVGPINDVTRLIVTSTAAMALTFKVTAAA